MDGMTGVILLFAMVVDERGPDGVFSLSPGALPRGEGGGFRGSGCVCVCGGFGGEGLSGDAPLKKGISRPSLLLAGLSPLGIEPRTL